MSSRSEYCEALREKIEKSLLEYQNLTDQYNELRERVKTLEEEQEIVSWVLEREKLETRLYFLRHQFHLCYYSLFETFDL